MDQMWKLTYSVLNHWLYLDFEAVRDTVGEDDNNLSSFPGRIMKVFFKN